MNCWKIRLSPQSVPWEWGFLAILVERIIAALWMYQDSPTGGKDAKEGEINNYYGSGLILHEILVLKLTQKL